VQHPSYNYNYTKAAFLYILKFNFDIGNNKIKVLCPTLACLMTSLLLYFVILLAPVSCFYYQYVIFCIFKACIDSVPNCNVTSRVHFKRIINLVRGLGWCNG
jgi:hypothetical protein